jgi:hypothetical protein
MQEHLRGRIEHIRARLENLQREFRSLNHEEQRAVLMEMRTAASIIDQMISDMEHPGTSSTNEAVPNDFNMPFDAWFKEKIRRGADYGSVADAAATYEAAGYNFL